MLWAGGEGGVDDTKAMLRPLGSAAAAGRCSLYVRRRGQLSLAR